MRQYCKQSKHFNTCEVIGALVGMWILLAVTAPIIYGGEYLYNRFIPAESILEIKGDINASDVIDGRQYLSYERCVDKDIVGTFVWELIDVERGLVRNYVVTAVIEQKDSCLINWELDQSSLQAGTYYWQTVITFYAGSTPKTVSAKSNFFNVP